jgi:hypothetical protein
MSTTFSLSVGYSASFSPSRHDEDFDKLVKVTRETLNDPPDAVRELAYRMLPAVYDIADIQQYGQSALENTFFVSHIDETMRVGFDASGGSEWRLWKEVIALAICQHVQQTMMLRYEMIVNIETA